MTQVSPFLAIALGLVPQVPTLTLVEETRIGAIDGPTALTEIVDLAVGADGRIYVAQWNVAEVVVFDRAGRMNARIGRSGAGPGEFRSPSRLGWSGDTLWVADPPQSRVSFFVEGRLTREDHLRPPPGVFLAPVGALRDGSILSERGVRSSDVLRGDVATTVLVRSHSQRPGILDTVATRAIGTMVRLPAANGRTVLIREPFTQGDLRGLTPDGETLIVVDHTPASKQYHVTWLSPLTGDTLVARALSTAARQRSPVWNPNSPVDGREG
jgi:hypothetical protein